LEINQLKDFLSAPALLFRPC